MGAFPKPEDIRQPAPVKEVLRRVIDTIPCLVTRSRPDGYVDFVNQRWREFTGLKLEDVLGWGWRAVLHPQDVQKYMRKWRAALTTGEPFEHEARLRRHDGEYRWFLIRKLPLRDEGGNIVSWYGTSHDVEDLKETTEKLRQSEAELRQIIDVIPAHVIVLEPDTSSFLAGRLPNRQALEYEGLTLQQVRADPMRVFHPDDVEKLLALRQASLAKEMPLEAEARIRRKDGQYRWFLIRLNPLRDDTGRILRWYGTRTDIDDQKRAEDHLRLVIDTIPQQIWSGPADGSLDFCNAQWLSYMGLTQEEAHGEGWQRMLHPEDRDRVLTAWRQSVATGAVYEQEERHRRADGQYRWFLSRGVPLRDSMGRLVRWYGTNTDITERKRLRDQLEHERDRLRLLLDLSNAFVSKLSLRDFFDALAEGLSEIESWEYSFVALPESAANLKLHLVGGSTGELKAGMTVPIEGTFVGDAYRSGQSSFFRVADLHPVPHYAELTSWRKFARAQGLRAGCNLPLRYGGKVLGVLGFHTRNDMERAREDLGFLQELAKLVALALHNALRYGELSESHDALRESEDRLRLVVDATPALLYSSRPDGYLDFFNKRWLDYLGRSLDDLSGWGWTSAIHPDDLEDLVDKWHTALATGQPYKTEARVRRADGEYRWMLLRKMPLRDQAGNIVKWYGSGIDVEEQHEAKTALEKAFNEIKALRDQLYKENLVLKDQIGQASGFEEMIGASAALRSVLVLVEKVAATDSTVLITGETGTGKELVARAIHKRSDRAPQAFISVNCSAIPASLVASELFGYEKGAFTGAVERRLGRFELADGGTVFLDEIGDLPAETQISLLRVLQERTFERVGGSQPISVDVRVLAATHRDLHAAVEARTFRQDLFYRLNVFPIHVPPLRDRVEDIPLLVRYFAEQYAKKAGKKIRNIKRKTLEILQAYDWPGNIRELQNVIERAVILCDGDTLAVDEEWLQIESPRPGVAARGLGRLDENREREIIESALRETRGRVSGSGGAAAKLGIPRSTLESRIRKLQIDKQRFTSG